MAGYNRAEWGRAQWRGAAEASPGWNAPFRVEALAVPASGGCLRTSGAKPCDVLEQCMAAGFVTAWYSEDQGGNAPHPVDPTSLFQGHVCHTEETGSEKIKNLLKVPGSRTRAV